MPAWHTINCLDCGVVVDRCKPAKVCIPCGTARANKQDRERAKRKPLQAKAGDAVAAAVRRGDLINLKRRRVKCVDCGKRAVAYDHRDYTKPLEVEPVCCRCNVRRGPALPYIKNNEGMVL